MANKSGRPRAIHPATRANLWNYSSDELIEARKVANNTWFARLKNGVNIYKFHDTEIIRVLPTGHIHLNHGGWQSSTTKNRMNVPQPLARPYPSQNTTPPQTYIF